ncbi:MAG: hypothetical protein WCA22_12680 [Candidatus Binatus sp.]
MNARFLGVIAFVCGLAIPVVAIAQSAPLSSIPQADRTALINQLDHQAQMDEIKAKFWTQEPVTQQNYYVQARQDRQLMRKVSKGELVSQAQIDQALSRVSTDY